MEEKRKARTEAKSEKLGKTVSASDVRKADGPFFDLITGEEVVVRKCTDKRDHFALLGRYSPVASRESRIHKECKKQLLQELQRLCPDGNWIDERKGFKKDKDKGYNRVVPDLSGRIHGKGVIVEVQISTLSIETILKRTETYSKRGAYIIWVLPLKEALGHEKFRPRLFEKFLHSMYYGRVYYWNEGDGLFLTPVHYDEATCYIEPKEYPDSNGQMQSGGGYEKRYKSFRTPNYGRNVHLVNDFKPEHNTGWEMKNEKKSVPPCNIYVDKERAWWKDSPTK